MITKEKKTSIILFILLGILFSVGAHFLEFRHEDNSKYTLNENLILGFIASSAVIFVPIIKNLINLFFKV